MQYNKVVQRTSPTALEYKDRLSMGSIKLGGEATELEYAIKIGSSTEEVLKEAGDVMWYLVYLSNQVSISWERVRRLALDEQTWAYKPGQSTTYHVGQVLEMVGKHLYHEHVLRVEEMASHIIGAVRSIAILAKWYGADLDVVCEMNNQKLLKRYPKGFDPARSYHDGQ